MDKRFLHFILWVFIILTFFQLFVFKPPKPVPPASGPTVTNAGEIESATAPASSGPAASQAALTRAEASQPASEPVETGQTVVVNTDSYSVAFNTLGAVPTSWQITDPHYVIKASKEQKNPEPIELIPPVPGAQDREYPLYFILREADSTRGLFDEFNRRNYTVKNSVDAKGNTVLTFTSPVLRDGLQLIKTITLPKSGFLCSVRLELVNKSSQQMRFDDGGMGPGLSWGPGVGGHTLNASRSMSVPDTAVWLTPDRTENIAGNSMKIGQITPYEGEVRWGGITNQYFFASLIPSQKAAGIRVSVKSRNSTPDMKHGLPTVEVFEKPLTLKPGQAAAYDYQLYVGPKSKEHLKPFDLDKILFFNSWRWFRALCLGLMWGLIKLRTFLPDYGWAIIALTIILRLITQPFVYYSLRSNARFAQVQKRLKPELDEINKKYKDNPQKKQEETWKLYKKHNANPLGALKGCFWMFLQMPFFFAFYRLLLMSIELRGAHFLWIDDLSLPDRLVMLPAGIPFIHAINLLPILMTATQYFTQKLTMTTSMDPSQKQMMVMMPVFFMFIMYNMSAGLVLYWFISNLWQIGSQLWINRKVKQEEEQAGHLATT